MQIFILATERSGSNLLRSILSAHNLIVAPPAPNIVSYLADYYQNYGDLQYRDNLLQLIHDCLDLCEIHPNPWGLESTAEEIADKIKIPTFWQVYHTIFQSYAEKEDKIHWVSKDIQSYRFAFEILAELDDVRFIYLARDGRDVALSMIKSDVHGKNVFLNANLWKKEQSQMLKLFHSLPKNRIIMTHYEDLLNNPTFEITKITDFLGIDFEENMVQFHQSEKSEQAAESSKYWENLTKPIMTSNYNKFINQMSLQDIWIFESVAGNQLSALGYGIVVKGPRIKIPLIKQFYYWISNIIQIKINKGSYLNEPNRQERKDLIRTIYKRLEVQREYSLFRLLPP